MGDKEMVPFLHFSKCVRTAEEILHHFSPAVLLLPDIGSLEMAFAALNRDIKVLPHKAPYSHTCPFSSFLIMPRITTYCHILLHYDRVLHYIATYC